MTYLLFGLIVFLLLSFRLGMVYLVWDMCNKSGYCNIFLFIIAGISPVLAMIAVFMAGLIKGANEGEDDNVFGFMTGFLISFIPTGIMIIIALLLTLSIYDATAELRGNDTNNSDVYTSEYGTSW